MEFPLRACHQSFFFFFSGSSPRCIARVMAAFLRCTPNFSQARERLFKVLSEDADNEYAMIDSTIVRAHQHSAGAKTKPSGAAAVVWFN